MGRPRRDTKPTPEMLALAKELKRFRAANLLSQNALAEVTGISRRTIQHIESAMEESPHQRVLDALKKLQSKYANEGRPSGKRKQKVA